MKYLIIILCGFSLSGCATMAGVATDVDRLVNPPAPYYYSGPPGQYRCLWRNGRRWCR